MFVVCFEESIVGGRRPEQEEAHQQALPLLSQQRGMQRATLLHFAGQPYRYRFVTRWENRQAWETFYHGESFPALRQSIDKNLSAPFIIELWDVKAEV